jgi:hypothetical protein
MFTPWKNVHVAADINVGILSIHSLIQSHNLSFQSYNFIILKQDGFEYWSAMLVAILSTSLIFISVTLQHVQM